MNHNKSVTSAQNASGPVRFNMTNDYMFRAVLQANNKVLRGLICSLLHLTEKDIISAEITNPVIHIGFLDYTLFRELPEFYATYKLLNVKNHSIYSDNFTLSVINLSQIDLATEEDKYYQIDYWAKLFKATTWEEIHMLASNNHYIHEASNTIFQLSADEQIRKQCLDREEYYRDIRTYKKIIQEKNSHITRQASTIQELRARIEELEANMHK